MLLYLCINSEQSRQDCHSHAICTNMSTNKYKIIDNDNCYNEKQQDKMKIIRKGCVLF